MAKHAMQQAVWTAMGLTVARLLLIWFEAWTIAKYQSLIMTFFGGFSISFLLFLFVEEITEKTAARKKRRESSVDALRQQ
ncbi:MAG: hypothetical protein K6E83_04870 [Clostridium sp.]|nr:hypothetical protein [Clostridium sp.]